MADVPRFALLLPATGTQQIEASHLISRPIPQSGFEVPTESQSTSSHRPSVPHRISPESSNIRSLSTPPESPTKGRLSVMTAHKISVGLNEGAVTPPVTPISSMQRKTSSTSDLLATMPSLQRVDSLSPTVSPRCSIDESVGPCSTDLINFPHTEIDYTFRTDAEGRKKPIGEGLWSDVYLAKSSTVGSTQSSLRVPIQGILSPPLTPAHSRNSSLSSEPTSDFPYAVKVPASTSAKKVLLAEAKILSYLSRFPDASDHIVPFHGYDSRNGSLVLGAMSCTLESWIQTHLNTLDESSRAAKLTSIFPSMALSLIDSLQWLHSKGCVHADIKPSNILLSPTPTPTGIPKLVFSDFSSTLLTLPGAHLSATPSPAGAGTWDYLDPLLLTSSSSSTPPSNTSDTWSLAITLLFLILGASPYEVFKHNSYQQREMIRHGVALNALAHDASGLRNMRRLRGLGNGVGVDVWMWFGRVLVKERGKRVALEEWRSVLVEGLARGNL